MKSNFINLLKWSQKYTKTDMVDLVHGSFWVTLAQGLVFIASFVLVWVCANFFTPEAYGEYRFLTTIVALLSLASLPGMTTAIVRAVARGHSGVIPEVVSMRVRWGLWATLAASIGAGYYFLQGNIELGLSFLCIALLVPFYQSYAVTNFYHNGRKDYKNYTLFTTIRRSTIVVATILAIVLTQNVFATLVVYLATTAAINYILYRYTIFRFPLSGTTDAETIAYGKKLSLMSILSAASSQLDKVALWYFAGPAPVAIYSIATAAPKEIASAFGNVGVLALPKMASRDKRQLRQSLLRKTFIYFMAAVPLTVVYIYSAPFLFYAFLPQYVDYVFYSQLSSALILLTPLILLTQYFSATMHTKAMFTMQFVLPAVLIGLYALLIPPFGVVGAVLALIGRQIAAGILLLGFFLFDTEKDSPLS